MGKKRIIQQTETELLKEQEKIQTKTKVKNSDGDKSVNLKKVKDAKVFISSSYNNTIFTLTDMRGSVLAWASAGSIGFKGTKKATPFAASKVAEAIFQIIKKLGIDQISILVKGIGSGRDSAVKSLAAKGLNIISIKEMTPVSHGGCRPPKPRRL